MINNIFVLYNRFSVSKELNYLKTTEEITITKQGILKRIDMKAKEAKSISKNGEIRNKINIHKPKNPKDILKHTKESKLILNNSK